MGDVQIQPDISYSERAIKILDKKERVTRHSPVKFYKVQWSNHTEREATWESKSFLLKHYPDVFSYMS